jgi:hypothetical protein
MKRVLRSCEQHLAGRDEVVVSMEDHLVQAGLVSRSERDGSREAVGAEVDAHKLFQQA